MSQSDTVTRVEWVNKTWPCFCILCFPSSGNRCIQYRRKPVLNQLHSHEGNVYECASMWNLETWLLLCLLRYLFNQQCSTEVYRATVADQSLEVNLWLLSHAVHMGQACFECMFSGLKRKVCQLVKNRCTPQKHFSVPEQPKNSWWTACMFSCCSEDTFKPSFNESWWVLWLLVVH